MPAFTPLPAFSLSPPPVRRHPITLSPFSLMPPDYFFSAAAAISRRYMRKRTV